jgi:hypothetical protein
MTARDIVTIGFYGVVFSSIVVWAALRPTSNHLAASSGLPRSSSGAAPLERAEGLPEMRRLVQRALLR